MEASIYYPSFRLFLANISEASNIYDNGYPTEEGYIIYSIVTPIICAFGIFGNTISLIVLNRRELKGSVYVYLAEQPEQLQEILTSFSVLAFSDLCSSILLFLSGLSCGVFFINSEWPIYDLNVGLPLALLFNTLSVLTTIMVTFDRICYLSNPLQNKKPKFCHATMARRIMLICFIISLITTIPYCFIFLSEEGSITPKKFFFSSFYNTYNWVRFILLGVLPSIFLICGNSYLIHALRKLKKLYGKCNKSIKCRKPENYTNLTTTLILIVFIFVISQIPSMLVNRATASTFFFTSTNTTSNSKFLENVREVSTVLSAISLSSDFVLYYLFCPSFCKVLSKIFQKKEKSKAPVQMNVFVLDKQICFDNTKSIKDLTASKLFHLMQVESNQDRLPSSIYDVSYEEDETTKPNRDTLITICPNNLST